MKLRFLILALALSLAASACAPANPAYDMDASAARTALLYGMGRCVKLSDAQYAAVRQMSGYRMAHYMAAMASTAEEADCAADAIRACEASFLGKCLSREEPAE